MAGEIELWEAVLLGAVEGVTEFLPISSTGHLTILERLLGYSTDDPDVTAFTAIIQVGAVLATLLFLRRDAVRIVRAVVRGMRSRAARDDPDFRFAMAIVLGTIPIAVVGLLFKDTIETTLRSLWFVGSALVLWSFVMRFADTRATQERGEADVTWRDTVIIGLTQCLALIPGVSRSGATMSAGLLRGLDRVTVTRLSFFLSIPALLAAGALQVVDEHDRIADGVGWAPTLLATGVSFVVAFATVGWLLRFIARHTYTVFIVYRIALGTLVLILVSTGAIAAAQSPSGPAPQKIAKLKLAATDGGDARGRMNFFARADNGEVTFKLFGSALEPIRERSAHGVWLVGGGRSRFLGFTPPTREDGKLATSGPREDDAKRFARWLSKAHRVLLTVETDSKAGRPGETALRGDLKDARIS